MASKKQAAKKETAQEREPVREPKKRVSAFKLFVFVLILVFVLPLGIKGVAAVGGGIVKYYKFILTPKKIIPDILPDFKKEDGQKRQRRRGIFNEDGRGINWTFSGASYKSVGDWVKGNIPSGADKETVKALSEAFYKAADAIYDGETTTPGRSLSLLKKEILLCADETWEDFFKGLTNEVAGQEIKSMEDVASLYEDIGDAFAEGGK